MTKDMRIDEDALASGGFQAIAKALDVISSGLQGELDLHRFREAGWSYMQIGHSVVFVKDNMTFMVIESALAAEPMARAAGLMSEYLASPLRRLDARVMPEAGRRALEEVGANFDDEGAVYGELVSRCIVGDAALAKHLGVHATRISQRVSERSVYSFVDNNDQRCYPQWQFVKKRIVHGLKAVLSNLDPDAHPLSVDRWFTRPDVDLIVDGTAASPIEWLRSGGAPSKVADHIRFL
jgi:hypothetical protein